MPIAELAVEPERHLWLQMVHCQGQLHPRAVGHPASTTEAHRLHQVLRLNVQGPETSKQVILLHRMVMTSKPRLPISTACVTPP